MAGRREAVVGVSDHGGWAVLVTALADGTVLDRRRVELVEEGLPKIPHHSEAQRLPVDEAVELVTRVRVSAERCSAVALEAVAGAVRAGIRGVALRECPAWLPDDVPARIRDYRAQNVADWVMYRRALARAAEARGWGVYWYDAKRVAGEAGAALGIADFDGWFGGMRKVMGAPWGADCKVALAGALGAKSSDGV